MSDSNFCKYCGVELMWLTTKKGKQTPVEPERIIRDEVDVLRPGKYYDLDGNCLDATNVPVGIVVYRSHWSDCAGANQARKK